MFKLKKLVSLALVAALLMSTVTCLGGVFSIGASAADPTWTDPTKTVTFGVGPIGGKVKTHAEAKAAYDEKYGVGTSDSKNGAGVGGNGGWIYLAADCYEVPIPDGTEDVMAYLNTNLATYLKTADISDGYVQPNDYIFTAISLDCSDGIYFGLSTVFANFDPAFFDFVASVTTATRLSNSNFTTTAATMNYDNSLVQKLFYSNYATKANCTAQAGQTGLSSTDLANVAAVTFAQSFDTSSTQKTVFQFNGVEWFAGFLLKVKDGLVDGTTGAIYAHPTFYVEPGKLSRPGFVNISYLSTTAVTSSKKLYNTNKAVASGMFSDAALILDDFGSCFIIGEPASGYTATFKDGDGTDFAVQTGVTSATDPCTDSKVPTKTGYTFSGWLDADKNAVTLPVTIAKNTTFTPAFTANEYDVTFDANGGTPNGSKKVAFDADITTDGITTPTNGAKNLLGWSRSQDAEEADATLGKMDSTEGVTLYAVWSAAPTYSYTFVDANNNTVYSNNTTGSVSEYTLPDDNIEKGMEFDYWAVDGVKVTTWPTTISENTTFTAVLKAKNYTVTWKDGVNPDKVDTVAYKGTITAPQDPVKTGYNFLDWDKEIPETMPAENLEFNAKFEAKKFSVKLYESKDAAEPFATLDATYDANKPNIAGNTEALDKVKDTIGKVFDGWYDKTTDALVSSTKNTPIGTGKYQTEGDTGVYFKFNDTPVARFYVADGEGGYVLAGEYNIKDIKASGTGTTWSSILTAAKAKAAEKNVTYDNALSLAWYTDSALTTSGCNTSGKDKAGNAFTSAESVDLYLGKPDATSTFEIPGSDPVNTTDKVAGDSVSIPVATLDKGAAAGEKFVGFYAADDETETLIDGKIGSSSYTFTLPAGTHSYIAKYEPIVYDVVVKVGNKTVAQTTASVGDTLDITKLEGVPAIGEDLVSIGTKGYQVTSWETKGYDFSKPVELTTENIGTLGYKTSTGAYQIVLSANVEAIKYTATFVCTDGATFSDGSDTKVLEIANGTNMDAMKQLLGDTPAKVGYIFSGWTPSTAMPAEDTTFTAVMIAKPCRLTFIFTKDADGNPLDYQSIGGEYGSKTMKIVDTEYEVASYWPSGVDCGRWQAGSIFTGWNITEGEFGEDNTVIGDMVFEAKYESLSNYLFVLYNSNIANPTDAATLGASTNKDICLTLSKKLKLTFWKDGTPVSIKEFKCNLDPDSFILLFKLRLNKMVLNEQLSTEALIDLVKGALGDDVAFDGNLKNLTADQAAAVKAAAEAKGYTTDLPEGGTLSITTSRTVKFLASCPMLLKWSFLNPLNIVDNFKLIVSVLGSLLK